LQRYAYVLRKCAESAAGLQQIDRVAAEVRILPLWAARTVISTIGEDRRRRREAGATQRPNYRLRRGGPEL
jgi:hypothetical protein